MVDSLKVLDDVGMSKLFEDIQFGLKLFALFCRHLEVGDLFAAEDLCVVSLRFHDKDVSLKAAVYIHSHHSSAALCE